MSSMTLRTGRVAYARSTYPRSRAPTSASRLMALVYPGSRPDPGPLSTSMMTVDHGYAVAAAHDSGRWRGWSRNGSTVGRRPTPDQRPEAGAGMGRVE